jgi:SAM-dependent methyltransferase
MRPEAYAEVRAVEDRHWWFRGRRRLLWALLRRTGGLPAGARVLDAGCGTGRNLVEFGGVGVDPAPEAVAACRARGLTDVVRAPVEALPFPDGSFDVLLAADVLEHVGDDAAALRELRRVARPSARLLVTVPAHPRLWRAHAAAPHHRRRYRRAELLARVRAAGWEPVVATWWNAFLLPAIAVARRRSRGADHARTPAWLDGVLALPLALEAWLIGRGVRLPAGVSLALACRPAQPDGEA